MKKRLSYLLILTLVLLSLSACTSNNAVELPASNGKYYVGFDAMTHYSNFDERENTGGSVEVIASTVIFDEAGKIVKLSTDAYEIRKAFTVDSNGLIKLKVAGVDQTIGAFPHERPDNPDALFTKYLMKENYGIGRADETLGVDWYKQLDAAESAFIGKTVYEIANMGWVVRTDGNKTPLYPFVNTKAAPDVDLVASASIAVDTHIQTIINAYENRVPLDNISDKPIENYKVGIGFTSELKAAESLFNVVVAGSIIDKDGLLTNIYTDAVSIPYTVVNKDTYKLVMIDSKNKMVERLPFEAADAGNIRMSSDMELNVGDSYYQFAQQPEDITTAKSVPVAISKKGTYMAADNTIAKALNDIAAKALQHKVSELDPSLLKEAIEYSKISN